MKAYLAGPMRGYPNYNFVQHYTAAALLRLQGHEVVSPAELDMECRATSFSENAPYGEQVRWDGDYKAACRRDEKAISECEAFVMLPGWERSKGTAAELKYVDKNMPRMPIYLYHCYASDGMPVLYFLRHSVAKNDKE